MTNKELGPIRSLNVGRYTYFVREGTGIVSIETGEESGQMAAVKVYWINYKDGSVIKVYAHATESVSYAPPETEER